MNKLYLGDNLEVMREMKSASIYEIIFPNNKRYIGKTSLENPEDRIQQHFNDAQKGSKLLVHNAIRKYGQNNITINWLHYKCVSESDLNDLERYYIAQKKTNDLQFGYNMTEGGEGVKGWKHSEESKEKIREAQKEYSKNPEVRKKRSEVHKGKVVTEETRQKMSDAQKGKKPSKESNDKRSKTLKIHWSNPEVRSKHKEIINTPEIKQKKAEAQKGKKHSEETKQKLSVIQTGRKLSEETKQKISKARKAYWADKKKKEGNIDE